MGVRRLAVANGPNIFQMLLVFKVVLIVMLLSGRVAALYSLSTLVMEHSVQPRWSVCLSSALTVSYTHLTLPTILRV